LIFMDIDPTASEQATTKGSSKPVADHQPLGKSAKVRGERPVRDWK